MSECHRTPPNPRRQPIAGCRFKAIHADAVPHTITSVSPQCSTSPMTTAKLDIKALVDAFAVTSLNTLRHVFTKLISLTEMLTQIPSAGIEETEDLDQRGFNVAHVIWESIPKEQREKSQLKHPLAALIEGYLNPPIKPDKRETGIMPNGARVGTRGGNAVQVWHPF